MSNVYCSTIILPRQARDKHIGKAEEEKAFCAGRWRQQPWVELCAPDSRFDASQHDPAFRLGAKNASFALLYTKNDRFTKIGSEKHSTRENSKGDGADAFQDGPTQFSAYRIHEQDPLLFRNGVQFVMRNGEVFGNTSAPDPECTGAGCSRHYKCFNLQKPPVARGVRQTLTLDPFIPPAS